jgi:DNA polymerase III epsilon subunit-like protein
VNHPVLFVDTETTGLNPRAHPIWEVAVIEADGTEHLWHIAWSRAVLDQAEQIALEMNGFEARYGKIDCPMLSPRESAERFAELSQGLHLVGAVISFDEERLRSMHDLNLGRPEGRYPWHYHLVDVEALAIGFLAGRLDMLGRTSDAVYVKPPWKSDQLSEALGLIPPSEGERHTALADARWAKAIYEQVMRGG